VPPELDHIVSDSLLAAQFERVPIAQVSESVHHASINEGATPRRHSSQQFRNRAASL
jgi:hypothetical protein